MSEYENNGWSEWKNHVLAELVRLNVTIREQDSQLNKLTELIVAVKVDIVTLKTKSTMWGSLAGFMAAIAVAIIGSYF